MWYEINNSDILELKEYWKSGEAGDISWEEFWNNHLYWHTKLRDKQKNYKRNGDIYYNQKSRIFRDKEITYTLSKYIPDPEQDWYISYVSGNTYGCLIMDWNE